MRRLKAQNGSRLTEDQIWYLVSGLCLDGYEPDYVHPRQVGNYPFRDEDDRRRLYLENRVFLFTLQAEKRTFGVFGFFERPAAFWDFEPLPEPRRTLKKFYGYGPEGWRYYDSPEGLYRAEPREVEESEREYLTRNNLLNEVELQLLQIENEKGENN